MALKMLEKKGPYLRSFSNGILVRNGMAKDKRTIYKHCTIFDKFFPHRGLGLQFWNYMYTRTEEVSK